VAVKILEKEKI